MADADPAPPAPDEPADGRRRSALRVARPTVGIGLCVLGAIWFAQGIGWLPGSFMSGDSTWTVIGLFTFIAGLGIVAWSRRSGGRLA